MATKRKMPPRTGARKGEEANVFWFGLALGAVIGAIAGVIAICAVSMARVNRMDGALAKCVYALTPYTLDDSRARLACVEAAEVLMAGGWVASAEVGEQA